jgi:Group II intron, maturase-specific domain
VQLVEGNRISSVASHLSINHNEATDPGRSTVLVVQLINPILSGWVNYFAIGDSGECFAFTEDWVVASTFVTAWQLVIAPKRPCR